MNDIVSYILFVLLGLLIGVLINIKLHGVDNDYDESDEPYDVS